MEFAFRYALPGSDPNFYASPPVSSWCGDNTPSASSFSLYSACNGSGEDVRNGGESQNTSSEEFVRQLEGFAEPINEELIPSMVPLTPDSIVKDSPLEIVYNASQSNNPGMPFKRKRGRPKDLVTDIDLGSTNSTFSQAAYKRHLKLGLKDGDNRGNLSSRTVHISQKVTGCLHLNVSGTLYSTCASTLARYPESRLGKMVNGQTPSLFDITRKQYIIDRDGVLFRHILNFLRSGSLDSLPDNFTETDALINEAIYYELTDLIDALSLRQHSRRTVILIEQTGENCSVSGRAGILAALFTDWLADTSLQGNDDHVDSISLSEHRPITATHALERVLCKGYAMIGSCCCRSNSNVLTVRYQLASGNS